LYSGIKGQDHVKLFTVYGNDEDSFNVIRHCFRC